MSAQAIQFRKEVRQIFWPWLLLVFGAVLCLLPFPSSYHWWWKLLDQGQAILPLGCFLGVPFLAALPFGSEFQQRTLTSLLAQPVDRGHVWLQKFLVVLIAAGSTASLFAFANRVEFGVMPDFWAVAAWMAVTAAGATVCTLVARSSIGGLALSSGCFWIFLLAWSYVADQVRSNGNLPIWFVGATVFAVLSCCVGSVLLARRVFLRLQSADGELGQDVLASSRLGFLALDFSWLRSRPRGPILNLLRREFHLLRLVWLLGLCSILVWSVLLLFGSIGRDRMELASIPIALALLLGLMIALLAGALSLGEEKTQGTHEWQLTLPVSASVQWSLKLLVALFSCAICSVGFPVCVLLARGWLAHDLYSYLGSVPLWFWFIAAISVTLLTFWSATAIKGTVRAILLFFPLVFALGFANALVQGWSFSFSDRLVQLFTTGFDPFSSFIMTMGWIDQRASFLPLLIGVMAAPVAVGLIQSHRMFSRHIEESKTQLLRRAFPLLAAVVVSSFLVSTGFLFMSRLHLKRDMVLEEAHHLIEKFEVESYNTPAPAVSRLTFDKLAKGALVSDDAHRWLNDASIIVHRDSVNANDPQPMVRWPFETAYPLIVGHGKTFVPYSAIIRTANGHTCNLRFWTTPNALGGVVYQSCQ